MNINQVTRAIEFGNFTNDDLNSVIEAIKMRRRNLAREAKQGLRIGDNVNFTSTKQGRNITGVVMKIAIKYVTVRTVNGSWRVPANMRSVIRDPEFA